MLATLAVPAATANAGQDPRRAQSAIQSGYDEGYRQGLRVGEDHGRRGQQFNFGIATEYRQGDYGWRPSYGSRDQYRSDFRVGFERGYRDGYQSVQISRRTATLVERARTKQRLLRLGVHERLQRRLPGRTE